MVCCCGGPCAFHLFCTWGKAEAKAFLLTMSLFCVFRTTPDPVRPEVQVVRTRTKNRSGQEVFPSIFSSHVRQNVSGPEILPHSPQSCLFCPTGKCCFWTTLVVWHSSVSWGWVLFPVPSDVKCSWKFEWSSLAWKVQVQKMAQECVLFHFSKWYPVPCSIPLPILTRLFLEEEDCKSRNPCSCKSWPFPQL